MKFKVEIDLGDIVTEVEEYGEYNLKDELLMGIQTEIKHSTMNYLRTLVIDEVKSRFQDEIKIQLPNMVSSLLQEMADKTILMPAGRVINKEGNLEMRENITISEYLLGRVFQNIFDVNTRREFDRHIDKIATATVSQFKDQYDQYFATQVVRKLGEQNLLQENLSKILGNDSNK